VGNGNKGAVENRVGSGGGKRDAVEERDTVRERYLRLAYGRCLLYIFSCDAGGSLSVRTRC
jgi:hypothetical protein